MHPRYHSQAQFFFITQSSKAPAQSAEDPEIAALRESQHDHLILPFPAPGVMPQAEAGEQNACQSDQDSAEDGE